MQDRPLGRPKTIGHCLSDGCIHPISARGLCRHHYAKAKRAGRFAERRLTVLCDFPGCHEQVYCMGMCARHYSRTRQLHRLHTDPAFRAYQLRYVLAGQKSHPDRTAAKKNRGQRVTRWPTYLAAQARAGAKRANCPIDIDASYIEELWARQKGLCHWLGLPMEPSMQTRSPSRPSVDKLEPSKGYVRGNVVLTTQFANMGRNACPAEHFATFVKSLREHMCKVTTQST